MHRHCRHICCRVILFARKLVECQENNVWVVFVHALIISDMALLTHLAMYHHWLHICQGYERVLMTLIRCDMTLWPAVYCLAPRPR